jgi:hypothetical protein
MCNFPKDGTGVTKFSTKVTGSDWTAGTMPSGINWKYFLGENLHFEKKNVMEKSSALPS